jgi:hypothetical protein
VKKLAAVLALVLMSFGVSPVLVVPAHADQHDDPYTAGVRTSCNVAVPAVVKRGTAPRIRVNVRPNGPSQGARPEGNVRVTISSRGTRIFTKTVGYRGSAVQVAGPTLSQTGRYQVRAHFRTADGSVFKSCSGSAAFDIRAGQSPSDDPGTGPSGGETPDGLLPDTGGPHLLWLLLALALVGSGGGLLYAARRRPHAPLYDV